MKIQLDTIQFKDYKLIGNEGQEIKPVTEFLQFLSAKNYSPNTIKNYAYDLKYYFEYLLIIQQGYESIGLRELANFIHYLRQYQKGKLLENMQQEEISILKQHFSPNTIKRILAAVTSFYTWLEYTQLSEKTFPAHIKTIDYKTVPVAGSYKAFLSFAKKQNQASTRIIKVKAHKTLPRPISQEPLYRIIDSLNAWRDKAILFLGLQGGLRIGEILGLCREDINFRKREVAIRFRAHNPNQSRVKNMQDRLIYIEEPEALDCLNQYLLYERPDSDSPYIFLAVKGKTKGQPLTYQGIYTIMDYHCKKLGIINRQFTLHGLRHTHATKLYSKGMSLLSLQKRLGHASPQTTQLYAYISDEQLKEEYCRALK